MFILAFGSRGAASIFVGRMLLDSRHELESIDSWLCSFARFPVWYLFEPSSKAVLVVDHASVFPNMFLRGVLCDYVAANCIRVEQGNNKLY
jgi:hypothetical protein